jgi:hypothetical protein
MASSKDQKKEIILQNEISKLIKDSLKVEENIYLSERLFVAHSVLLWIFKNYKDSQQIKFYIQQVERHLKKEITLYWEDDIVKIMKKNKRR